MIRLFAGLLVASSFFVVAQQGTVFAADGAQPSARSLKGEPGVSSASAVVNFMDLAAEEKANPKKIQSYPARGAMPMPEHWRKRSSTSTAQDTDPIAAIKAAAASLSPAPAADFLGAPDNGQNIPPDTMGAVGPRHLMVMLNGTVRIQDRSGALLSSMTLNQFWTRVGPFVSNGAFDPKVYFDADAQRWLVVACVDSSSAQNSVLIGMSQTDDPRGQWNLYRIDSDPTDTDWADYPSVGYNKDKVVVTMNMFNNSTDVFDYHKVWVFDKSKLVQGAAQATFTSMTEPSAATMVPARTYDITEQTIYILETFDDRSLRLSSITGPVGADSLNVGIATVRSGSYTWNLQGGQIGRQLGSTALIQCNDSRMLGCEFRNGSLWATHEVFFPATGAPSRASVQWWQISVNGAVIQQALIDDPSGNASYVFPSIAVNSNSEVLIGYSKLAGDQYAAAAYSFRAPTDPLNTLQSDRILKAGEGVYFKDFNSGRNRWGDYSATMVDPLNDQDMWTLQEYAAAPLGGVSQWGVWWGMVALSEPPDDVLELQVSPPTLSDVAQGQATDFFAVVTDSYLQINNATVTASIPGRSGVITFRNDGAFPDVTANDNVYSASITFNSPSESPVTFTATAPGKTAATVVNVYNVIQRPPNDNFANAIKIPAPGIFGLNVAEVPNNFATTEPNEPVHAGVSNFRSLWWNYSTDTAAPVLVDTSGSGPKLVIAVYTGNSLGSLFPVASTNPAPNTEAILKFDAQPGVTYRIVVAGADSGEKGIVRLRVQPNGEPDTAPPIVTVQFPPSGLVTNVQTVTFRGTVIDPAPQASGVNAVLVQDFQLRPRSVIQATLNGSTWTATVQLTRATNIFAVQGVDFADNTSAEQLITVYYRPTSNTNDLFGFARVLPPPSGVDFATTTNATREFNEPLHGGNEGGKSVWWSYTPTKSGVLSLSTEGSNFDTLLGVYTVNDPQDRSLSSLIPVAQNDDSLDRADGTSEIPGFAVEAGRLYYIGVDGYGGASGDVRLSYTFSESAVFNVTTSSGAGGTITPSSRAFPSESAVTVTGTPDRYKQFSRFIITQNGITTVVTNGPSYTFALLGDTQVRVEFADKQFADDFQSGSFNRLPYQISSSASVGQHWVVAQVETNSVTHQGSLVARVRSDLPDATTASLVVVTNLAPGIGSFEFSVNTETNYDKFEFSIDGRVLGTWSGTVPWQTFFFDIPAKATPTRLEWRYVKDLALSAANELVAIDNIDIRPVAPPEPVALTLSITADASQVTIIASGPPNTDFRLESSTDLINWAPVADGERNSGPSGIVTFIQPAPTSARRFYKVVQL
jgi:hypothetical protein